MRSVKNLMFRFFISDDFALWLQWLSLILETIQYRPIDDSDMQAYLLISNRYGTVPYLFKSHLFRDCGSAKLCVGPETRKGE